MATGGYTRRTFSHLAVYLAVVSALLIVFASLQPFDGWAERAPGSRFFLLSSARIRFVWSDIWINVIAYVPLGFFVALVRRRDRRRIGPVWAVIACALLSFTLETLQMWLPQRVSSPLDLAANAVGGTAGALLARLLDRRPVLLERIAAWRESVLIGGRLGDLGVTLLGLWVLAHVNPAVPLFAIGFDSAAAEVDADDDLADRLIEAAEIAFNVVGVGLFVGLLVRRRPHLGVAVAALVGSVLALKSAAASAMLTAEAWSRWLNPTVTLGMSAGMTALLALVWLPRPAQMALCSIALLSALVTQLLAPELLLARAPLAMFSWSYGQLLHFNGLTQIVLLAWPIAVSLHLLALAGKPGWGREEAGRV